MAPDENIQRDYTHSHIQFFKFRGDHAAISTIGIIHGLASNDELLLLLTLALGISSFYLIFIGLLIFTIGVVVGMILFATIVRISITNVNQDRILRLINIVISVITIAYGIYILFGGEGLNLVPVINEENLDGTLFLVAFILGIKHSMDADHVVAISSILLRSERIIDTFTLSISWALGHMITASVITFILFSFKELLLDRVLANFEILVAFMLIIIGVLTLAWEFDFIKFGKHSHGHIHEDGKDIHIHE